MARLPPREFQHPVKLDLEIARLSEGYVSDSSRQLLKESIELDFRELYGRGLTPDVSDKTKAIEDQPLTRPPSWTSDYAPAIAFAWIFGVLAIAVLVNRGDKNAAIEMLVGIVLVFGAQHFRVRKVRAARATLLQARQKIQEERALDGGKKGP